MEGSVSGMCSILPSVSSATVSPADPIITLVLATQWLCSVWWRSIPRSSVPIKPIGEIFPAGDRSGGRECCPFVSVYSTLRSWFNTYLPTNGRDYDRPKFHDRRISDLLCHRDRIVGNGSV